MTNLLTPKQQTVTDVVADIVNMVNISNTTLKQQYKLVHDFVWNGGAPYGAPEEQKIHSYTPEEIFAEFGTDSVSLLQISLATEALLAQLNSDYTALEINGYTITPNQDGTVTLTPPSE